MVKNKVFLAILIIFSLVTIAYGSETNFDGKFWRQSDRTTKELFTYGVMGGIELGQDRVISTVMQDMTNQIIGSKCFQSVTKNVDSLESDLKNITAEQIIAGIDQFYSDSRNRTVRVKWGFLVVMQQLKGTPREDIEKFIEHVRNKAD